MCSEAVCDAVSVPASAKRWQVCAGDGSQRRHIARGNAVAELGDELHETVRGQLARPGPLPTSRDMTARLGLDRRNHSAIPLDLDSVFEGPPILSRGPIQDQIEWQIEWQNRACGCLSQACECWCGLVFLLVRCLTSGYGTLR